MRAASEAAAASDARSRDGFGDCCDNLDGKAKNDVSKSSSLLEKSAPCTEVEGVTPTGARGTAQKASVPVRDPVTEVETSKVNPEFEGEELKIVKLLSQDLSVKDSVIQAGVTASEGGEKEDAVDALLEVPCERMPENPDSGCEPIQPVTDTSEKASSGNKQMSH